MKYSPSYEVQPIGEMMSQYVFKWVAILALFGAAQCASAASTYTYNLTTDPTTVNISGGTETINNKVYPLIDYTFSLTNAMTGLNSVPAVTLKTGDTINGTITFSSSWTLPATADGVNLFLGLQPYEVGDVPVNITNESIAFFNNGTPVSPPFPTDISTGAGGYLEIGIGDSWNSTATFAFDQIEFSGTMTPVANSNVISPISLVSGVPTLDVYAVSPVPEVDSYKMLFAGLGLIVLVVRRKSKRAQ